MPAFVTQAAKFLTAAIAMLIAQLTQAHLLLGGLMIALGTVNVSALPAPAGKIAASVIAFGGALLAGIPEAIRILQGAESALSQLLAHAGLKKPTTPAAK